LLALDVAVNAVMDAPHRWPKRAHGCRHYAFTSRYPLSLVYRLDTVVERRCGASSSAARVLGGALSAVLSQNKRMQRARVMDKLVLRSGHRRVADLRRSASVLSGPVGQE
jgi:hypothetical protein